MKFLIIGAGPAGLAFANSLLRNGVDDFEVIEKESLPGGLCRSVNYAGAPLDIGGGHFLDVRNSEVNRFVFSFMPEGEWNKFNRNSKICINDTMIDYPIESNIWQLSVEEQVKYIKSVVLAGCNQNVQTPDKFLDWITWKLGDEIAENYMIPYNQKMFGEDLDCLGTYWLDKLPNVSTDEVILSCLNRKAYGKQPAHRQFYYPINFGYGEVWRRMAEKLGDKIHYNVEARELNIENHSVNDEFCAEYIVNTSPWTSFRNYVGVNNDILKEISLLKHSSIVVEYHEDVIETEAHWIYYPDSKYRFHRILMRSNFCTDSKGYWTETNSNRYVKTDKYSICNEYAYPLNTIDKEHAISNILEYFRQYKVIGLGRWGEWQHFNSDVVTERAMKLASILSGNDRGD